MFSGVLSGRDDLRARVQPQCGWLISDAPSEQRARTVPRSGVSSVRLMRHCPRSYAVGIIFETFITFSAFKLSNHFDSQGRRPKWAFSAFSRIIGLLFVRN